MKMQWCWHFRHSAVGEKLEVTFVDGDMYIMEEKAVGTDWRKSSLFTLRHAAGAPKYLQEKRKPDGEDKAKVKLLEMFSRV